MQMKAEMVKFAAPAGLSEADDLHRRAYNAAFWDMGFKWQWDAGIYRDLCRLPEEKARLRIYIEHQQPHLFAAYDAEFLIDLICEKKARRYDAMLAARAAGRPLDLTCNGPKGTE